MNNTFGIVTAEHCYLRSKAGVCGEQNESGITDEIFSGWAVRLLPETEQNGWVRIDTHYGYQGYVRKSELRPTDETELAARQDKSRFFRIGTAAADLLDRPDVEGLPLELLLKNAFVELLGQEEKGWSRIRTAAGREGYVHTEYLRRREDDDGYLLEQGGCQKNGCGEQNACQVGGRAEENARQAAGTDYFAERFQDMNTDEHTLRERVAASALSYLGTQYRWGGKSSQGLDCSGLVFMSYMENGVLLYRDAKIMPGYPVREITQAELQKGDLIFFPGHVGMYLEDGKFIHSTAWAATPQVTINSLRPEDENYRPDLAEKITACGSVFAGAGENAASAGKAEQAAQSGLISAGEAHFASLEERLRALPGSVSVVYMPLDKKGEPFFYRETESHPAASVIKLFLMAAVFQCFEDGRFAPDERLRVPENCAPSCGVLYYLRDVQTVSVRDLTELMVIVSDNTATNMLFDLVGESYLDTFIHERLGMKRTAFRRKMFDAERAAQGIENEVTAADAAHLLEWIYRGELVSAQASAQMYRILTHQRLNGKIPFYLHAMPEAPVIAHKTGEDTGVTHDVAIVEGKKPFVLCFLGSRTDVPAYERLMAETARELFCQNQEEREEQK